MPKNAVVTLRYGPYSAVGLSVEHRTFRLEGLQENKPNNVSVLISTKGAVECDNQHARSDAVLAADGHLVILEKMEDWNVVELKVNEEVVFHCNIKDLEFGGDGKLDPLCQEARIAVLNAY